jgi:hypothetical protein
MMNWKSSLIVFTFISLKTMRIMLQRTALQCLKPYTISEVATALLTAATTTATTTATQIFLNGKWDTATAITTTTTAAAAATTTATQIFLNGKWDYFNP